MPGRTIFAFDLDGTVTRAEILPVLARAAGVPGEVSRLTRLTLDGRLAFCESFTRRFGLLRHLPLAEARRMVQAVPLDPRIATFIRTRPRDCAIVTGNIDLWIEPLVRGLGCMVHCSRAVVRDGSLHLASIVDKAEVVTAMRRNGHRVVAIGDAANDLGMLRAADMGIAYAGVNRPPPEVVLAADHLVENSDVLCELLSTLA